MGLSWQIGQASGMGIYTGRKGDIPYVRIMVLSADLRPIFRSFIIECVLRFLYFMFITFKAKFVGIVMYSIAILICEKI